MKSLSFRLFVLAIVWFFLISTIPGYTDTEIAADSLQTGHPFTWQAFKTNLHLMFFSSTDYYIRHDGGLLGTTTGTCDGKTNAPLAGSTGGHCGLNDIKLLQVPFTRTWSVAGGDRIHLVDFGLANPYYIGEQNLGLGTDWSSTFPADCSLPNTDSPNCILPALPDGTSGAHTQLLGANVGQCYNDQTKCSFMMGLNHLFWVYANDNTQYNDIEGIAIGQPDSCTVGGSGFLTGGTGGSTCSHAGPVNNYATYGIEHAFQGEQGPSNGIEYDLQIVGIGSKCWHGSHFNRISGDVMTIDHVKYVACGLTGFETDGDLGGTSNESVGTMNISFTQGQWNGCSPVLPTGGGNLGSNGFTGCTGQSTGGQGDCFTLQATGGTWNITDSSCNYSMQDGFDGLHIGDDPSNQPTVLFARITSIGDAGQAFKMSGNATVLNSFFVGNCRRLTQPFTGNPTNYNTFAGPDACRAGSTAMALQLINGGFTHVYFTTLVTYTDTPITFTCAFGQTCSTTTVVDYENNIFLGFGDPGNSGQIPHGFYYGTVHDDPNTPILSDPFLNTGSSIRNNLWFNILAGAVGGPCPQDTAVETNYLCVDPQLTAEGSIDPTTLDGVNPIPAPGSPVIATGFAISGVTTDYSGATRPNPPSIGALEPVGTPTVATPTFAPSAGSFGPSQSITISTTTPSASLVFTNDGSTPTVTALTCTITHGTLYTGALTVATSQTLKAIGCLASDNASAVGTAAYVINGAVANPACTPAGGSFTSAQSVTCSSATVGSSTTCTIDGSTPTHGSPACTAISVTSSLTLKALSFETGWSDSSVISNAYVITLPPPNINAVGTIKMTGTVHIP